MPTPLRRLSAAPVVLSLAALVAVLPMLLHGPSCGHDFDFHVLSWLEAANQFARFGYPHWAFTPAWNAGEPRFVFYPPLSWALGALLGLILPWTLVPAAFTWVALTLSGLTMYRLARRYASQDNALLAATLYLANPYMLFTAYERTAYGELLAAAWLPLLLAAALAQRVRMLPIAFAIALLWLTNAPAAVMGSYTLAFLTAIRLILPSSLFPLPLRLRLAFTTIAGTALGLALTAFYLIPAAYEQRFVQVGMAVIPGMRPAEHFLFHHMGTNSPDDLFHDQVVRTASTVALILLAAIAAALLLSLKRTSTCSVPHPSPHSGDGWEPQIPGPRLPLSLLTLLIAFLLTPPSLFLWNYLPKLAFLQFPWRLTALLGVILATLIAQALNRLRVPVPSSLLPLPLSLLLVFPAWHFFAQGCDFEDTVPARVALFHSNAGTEPTDEYTPKVDDNDALSHADPPYWFLPIERPPAPGSNDVGIFHGPWPLQLPDTGPPPSDAEPGQAPSHLALNLSQPEYLVLNRREFPFWRVLVNGRPISPELTLRERLFGYDRPLSSLPEWNSSSLAPRRPDGLLVLDLPAGHSTVDIVYRRTPDQTAGLILSGLASLGSLGLIRRRRTHPGRS
jgi:hypothetical protein